MSAPFFSIVIPTRDRPQFILDTAISAVAQQFDSFEVILSDNSHDDRTRHQLHASKQVGGITYIRPPQELSMPDHWEFATSHSNGKFVLVLTDRSVLKQGALAAVYRAIADRGNNVVQVCSWRWSLFDDELGVELHESGGTLALGGRTLSSAEVLAEFSGQQKHYPYTLPRALNSCYSSEMAAKLRTQYGRLFFPLNPDFTSAFLLLTHIEKMLHIDAPLFVSRGLGSSGGGNAYLSDATSYLNTLGIKDCYRYVPIKASLVENVIFEDFLAMRDMAGGGLGVEIDWVEYFVRCYREILGKRGQNILTRQQIGVLQREWERALKGMSENTQRGVRMGLRSMRGLRMRATVRELLCDLGLLKAIRSLRKFDRSPGALRTTALKAAGHELPLNAADKRAA